MPYRKTNRKKNRKTNRKTKKRIMKGGSAINIPHRELILSSGKHRITEAQKRNLLQMAQNRHAAKSQTRRSSRNRSKNRTKIPTNANRRALDKQARDNNKTRTSRHNSSKKLKGINQVALAMMMKTQRNERPKFYSMLKNNNNIDPDVMEQLRFMAERNQNTTASEYHVNESESEAPVFLQRAQSANANVNNYTKNFSGRNWARQHKKMSNINKKKK